MARREEIGCRGAEQVAAGSHSRRPRARCDEIDENRKPPLAIIAWIISIEGDQRRQSFGVIDWVSPSALGVDVVERRRNSHDEKR